MTEWQGYMIVGLLMLMVAQREDNKWMAAGIAIAALLNFTAALFA